MALLVALTCRAFSASRCSSARARVILESIRPNGRTRITGGRNGRGGQTFEHGAAPRAGHNTRRGRTSRSHRRVATRTLCVNEAPNPPLPEERPPGEGNETRDAAPVRHLTPWIKESAPSSATSSPLARSAWRTTTKRCSRSSGSNTEGEARTDTTTRGTSSAPRGLRRVHLGRGTLRHERRAGGIRESKA